MPKAVWYIGAAAVVAYLVLRPKGKVGSTAPRSAPSSGAGLAEQVGSVVDGVVRLFRATPDSPPVTEQGDIAMFPG